MGRRRDRRLIRRAKGASQREARRRSRSMARRQKVDGGLVGLVVGVIATNLLSAGKVVLLAVIGLALSGCTFSTSEVLFEAGSIVVDRSGGPAEGTMPEGFWISIDQAGTASGRQEVQAELKAKAGLVPGVEE